MEWLFDTNILSELRRERPDTRVLAFVAACRFKSLHISCVTLAEIRFGIDILTDPVRQAEFNHWLSYTVRPMFANRVIDITEDIMLRWRLMHELSRKAGRQVSAPDLLIAATAFEHRLTVVTRNVKDFTGLGVPILNPWESHPGTTLP